MLGREGIDSGPHYNMFFKGRFFSNVVFYYSILKKRFFMFSKKYACFAKFLHPKKMFLC